MIMANKSIFFLVCLVALCIMSKAEKKSPVILITENEHVAIKTSDDIYEISKTLEELKAISITTENLEGLLSELKQVANSVQIKKEHISSLFIDRNDIQKLKFTNFEDQMPLEKLKSMIQKKSHNILIQINQNQKPQKRLLENLQIQPKSIDQPTLSPLFLNMNSVTLTGLLVSLFLVLILLVALKCLYDVKTNDQFGRSNLWVGKES